MASAGIRRSTAGNETCATSSLPKPGRGASALAGGTSSCAIGARGPGAGQRRRGQCPCRRHLELRDRGEGARRWAVTAGSVPLLAVPQAARSGRGGPALGGDGRVSALAGGASGCAIGARWRGRWAAAAGSVPLRAVPQAAQPGRGGPALGSGGGVSALAGGASGRATRARWPGAGQRRQGRCPCWRWLRLRDRGEVARALGSGGRVRAVAGGASGRATRARWPSAGQRRQGRCRCRR